MKAKNTDTLPANCPPCILAIDQATRSGWALINIAGGKRIASGVFDSRSPRAEGGESRGMRFLRFYKWLEELLSRGNVSMVCHEQTIAMGMGGRHTSWATNDIAAALKGMIELHACTSKIACTSVCPSTLKKWATGNGRASKADMIKAAVDRCDGYKPQDDNEADAILIGLWAYETFGAALISCHSVGEFMR